MKKNNILILVLLLFANTCIAQKQEKLHFFGVPQVQLLNGTGKVSGAVNISFGLQKANNAYSINTGIDYYRYRTIPIIAEYKRYFGNKNQKPFVYAGLGYSANWLLDNQKRQIYNWWSSFWPTTANDATYKNGITYQLGVGYAIHNKQQKGLQLSIGLQAKTLQERFEEMVFNGTTSVPMQRVYNYQLNRLQLTLGYKL